MNLETKFNVSDIVYWLEAEYKWNHTCPNCGTPKATREKTGHTVLKGKVEAISIYKHLSSNIDIMYIIREFIETKSKYFDYVGNEIIEERLFATKKEAEKNKGKISR